MIRLGFIVASLLSTVACVVHDSTHYLAKRSDLHERQAVCYIDAFGSPFSCIPSAKCCTGVNFATCVPINGVCCDWGNSVGYCLAGDSCGGVNAMGRGQCNRGNGGGPDTPPVLNVSSLKEEPDEPSQTAPPAPARSEDPKESPSEEPKPKDDDGLPKATIIGVAVSVSCSVIAMIVGIALKIRRHKKKKLESSF